MTPLMSDVTVICRASSLSGTTQTFWTEVPGVGMACLKKELACRVGSNRVAAAAVLVVNNPTRSNTSENSKRIFMAK